jgi:hypothetical protein
VGNSEPCRKTSCGGWGGLMRWAKICRIRSGRWESTNVRARRGWRGWKKIFLKICNGCGSGFTNLSEVKIAGKLGLNGCWPDALFGTPRVQNYGLTGRMHGSAMVCLTSLLSCNTGRIEIISSPVTFQPTESLPLRHLRTLYEFFMLSIALTIRTATGGSVHIARGSDRPESRTAIPSAITCLAIGADI